MYYLVNYYDKTGRNYPTEKKIKASQALLLVEDKYSSEKIKFIDKLINILQKSPTNETRKNSIIRKLNLVKQTLKHDSMSAQIVLKPDSNKLNFYNYKLMTLQANLQYDANKNYLKLYLKKRKTVAKSINDKISSYNFVSLCVDKNFFESLLNFWYLVDTELIIYKEKQYISSLTRLARMFSGTIKNISISSDEFHDNINELRFHSARFGIDENYPQSAKVKMISPGIRLTVNLRSHRGLFSYFAATPFYSFAEDKSASNTFEKVIEKILPELFPRLNKMIRILV